MNYWKRRLDAVMEVIHEHERGWVGQSIAHFEQNRLLPHSEGLYAVAGCQTNVFDVRKLQWFVLFAFAEERFFRTKNMATSPRPTRQQQYL